MLPVSRDLVSAVFDRLVPADDVPSASGAGLVEWLDDRHDGDHRRIWSVLEPGFAALEGAAIARVRRARSPRSRPSNRTRSLLPTKRATERGSSRRPVGSRPRATTAAPGPGWEMVGYRAGPRRAPKAEVVHSRLTTSGLAGAGDDYDVVVIGAGAGGGVAACVLAESGARVLLVERGQWLPFSDVGADHVRNHRLAVYGDNTPVAIPAGPRVLATAQEASG